MESSLKPLTSGAFSLGDGAGSGEPSVLARGSAIRGELEFAGSASFAGMLEGVALCQGTLTIQAGAVITGTVRAHTIVVAGTFEGVLEAQAKISLKAGASVRADLISPSLIIEDGAEFQGRCSMPLSSTSSGQPSLAA